MLLAVAEAAGLRAEDEVAAKPIELSEVCLHAFDFCFLIDLAHPSFVVGLRGRAVLCLCHDAIETRRQ